MVVVFVVCYLVFILDLATKTNITTAATITQERTIKTMADVLSFFSSVNIAVLVVPIESTSSNV